MFLDEIVRHKALVVERSKEILPLAGLVALAKRARAARPCRGFARALASADGVAIIAEMKRASPSKGALRSDFDPRGLARAYEEGGASAVSVLTDERYFGGRREHLTIARAAARLPILRKDFVLEDYQVYEARAFGADAVLLIAAILDDPALRRLLELAVGLGMDALVEVHTREELERAAQAGARLIGINNRDLRTFQVSLSTTLELAPHAPHDALLVSESGIRSHEDIVRVETAGVRAVLVGEVLMRAPDPRRALRELLGGCGRGDGHGHDGERGRRRAEDDAG